MLTRNKKQTYTYKLILPDMYTYSHDIYKRGVGVR